GAWGTKWRGRTVGAEPAPRSSNTTVSRTGYQDLAARLQLLMPSRPISRFTRAVGDRRSAYHRFGDVHMTHRRGSLRRRMRLRNMGIGVTWSTVAGARRAGWQVPAAPAPRGRVRTAADGRWRGWGRRRRAARRPGCSAPRRWPGTGPRGPRPPPPPGAPTRYGPRTGRPAAGRASRVTRHASRRRPDRS